MEESVPLEELAMGKYKELVSDTFIFGIGNFLTKFISFFLMPIYTSDMSPEAFGLSDLLTNSLSLCIPFLSLSIVEAVFRFTMDKNVNRSVIFSIGLKVLSFGYIIIMPVLILIDIYAKEVWLSLIGILYITESLKNLLSQFARGLHYIKIFAISGVINAGSLFIFTYIFISFYHWEVAGYILSFIVANIIAIIYLTITVKIYKYLNFNAEGKTKEMLKYSIPLIPNTLSWWFTNVSSRYFIALFCGITTAGLYSAASRIPALINVLATMFQQAWQYATVKQYQTGSTDNFFVNVYKIYSVGICVIGSVIITLLPYISLFILKGEFYQSWIYTPLLIISAMLGCLSIFFGTFYQMLKKSKKIMNTTIIGAILSTVICVMLIPILGVWGALIASCCGYAAIVSYRIFDCRKILNIHFPLVSTLILFFIVTIQAILLSIYGLDGIYISIGISGCLTLFGIYKGLKILNKQING